MSRKFIFILLSILLLTFCGCNLNSSLQSAETKVEPNLAVGSRVPEIVIEDQFGKSHRLGENVKKIVFAFDMELAKSTNLLLADVPEFLSKNETQYVSDISPMPAIISKLFAKPKMRSYSYPILLMDNKDFTLAVPKKKDKLTLFILSKDLSITEIRFLDSISEIN